MSAVARRVLVTGARGFVGRRCLPILAERGFEVHAVSSTASSGEGIAVWHRCNLLDDAQVATIVARIRASHLLHLAWIATPGVFWTSAANLSWLAASVRLVDRFFASGGARVVSAGSCAEYGESDARCREDSTPLAPDTVYGEAKVAMYFALRAAARGRGTWSWARLFFPYGPGEPEGRFIPSVIAGILRREKVLCTHGRQVRDFVFIDDVAQACAALLDSEVEGAFNIGTGRETSLMQVADLVVSELGHGELLRFGERPAPAHDHAYVVADAAKASRELGWVASVDLHEGIRRTIADRIASSEKVS